MRQHAGSRRSLLIGAGTLGTLSSLSLPAAGQTKRGSNDRILRIAFAIPEVGFDPVQSQDAYSSQVNLHLFESPYEYDPLADPAVMRPNTAAEMPLLSADYRTLTIRIAPGIYFVDDPAFKGKRRELVAADYVYSWKRFFDPRWKSQNLYLVETAGILGINQLRQAALKARTRFDYDTEIEGLRTLDRYTLQLRFAQPNPRFHLNLASSPFGAVAREVVEAYGDSIAEHPVGTGPYRLAAWRRSSRIVLARNPNFRHKVYAADPPPNDAVAVEAARRLRGRPLPLNDGVEISVIQESQPRWLAFLQGEMDIVSPLSDLMELAAPGGTIAPHLARRGIRLSSTVMPGVTLNYFNMEHPLVGGYSPEKVALRRAIALGFDSGQFIQQILRGQGAVAQSPFVPNSFGFDPAFRTEMGEYDPARAKALLDMFGYRDRDGDGWREQPDGSPLLLEISAGPSQLERRQNELWQRGLSAIGLRSRFNIAQWQELLKQSLAGKLMIWGFSWTSQSADPDLFFGFGYSRNIEQTNDARFALPAFDAVYERSQRLPDGAERLAALREAARIFAAYVPYKFIAYPSANAAVHPWVIGYRRHPFTTRIWDVIEVDSTVRAIG